MVTPDLGNAHVPVALAVFHLEGNIHVTTEPNTCRSSTGNTMHLVAFVKHHPVPFTLATGPHMTWAVTHAPRDAQANVAPKSFTMARSCGVCCDQDSAAAHDEVQRGITLVCRGTVVHAHRHRGCMRFKLLLPIRDQAFGANDQRGTSALAAKEA